MGQMALGFAKVGGARKRPRQRALGQPRASRYPVPKQIGLAEQIYTMAYELGWVKGYKTVHADFGVDPPRMSAHGFGDKGKYHDYWVRGWHDGYHAGHQGYRACAGGKYRVFERSGGGIWRQRRA